MNDKHYSFKKLLIPGSSQEDALYLCNIWDIAKVEWSSSYSYHHHWQTSLQLSFHALMVFRSKELRESLSRPSSRLSCENGMEKMGKDVVRIVTKMNVVDNCNHPDYNGNDQGRRDIWPNQCVHHLPAAVIPTCRQVPQDPADPCLTRPTSLLFHHHDILIYHRIVIYHIWNIDDI